MNKLRKFLISGLAVCAIGCTAAGLAACTSKDSYPLYRKPVDYVEPGEVDPEFKGNYTVAVMTAGGMRINGVKVDVKLNGETKFSAISMDNGEISFKTEPAEYELVVDESTLPTGYFIGNEKFKTSATSGNASVIVDSKVMLTTAVSSHRYALGDVMYDFSYEDNNGQRRVLSDLLSEDSQYKAVVLNFWYIGCGPCRDEFPALQAAYENYKDKIKLIAISTEDSQSAINTFRSENKYTFDMVQDYSGLASLFSITSTPATIVIDRYGVYVNYEVGKQVDSRIWSSKFAHYVSDNYVQDPTADKNDDDENNSSDIIQRVEPDIPEDDYGKFPEILNGSGANGKITEYYGATTENDKKYNWPWISDLGTDLGRPHVKTTNAKTGNSFSILSMTVSLAKGDYISYDYFTSTEAGQDNLYVLINGNIVAQHSGETRDGLDPAANGWVTNRAVYTASRNMTLEVAFCYMKDEMKDDGEDYVAISNITIENVKNAVEAIDMKTDACSGVVDPKDNTRYTEYETPYFNENDKYYHVKYDGHDSILYLDYVGTSAWSDLHIGSTTFKPLNYGVSQVASLYMMLYWDYTNWKTTTDDDPLRLTIGGNDADRLTETFINSYYINIFSPIGAIPVTQDVKDLIEVFIKEYCRIENINYHSDMWLEFCCYYMHFGNQHTYIDRELYDDKVPVVFDDANNVYRVNNGVSVLDDKVYIDFLRSGAFGIKNSSDVLEYYSLETCIKDKRFDLTGPFNYTEIITAYLNKAKANSGDLYGYVEADKDLVNILKDFVRAYGYTGADDWQMFAAYRNIGDCNSTSDPVPGMTFVNPYEAAEGKNVIDVWNSHTIDGGGMLAKFVPEKSGVYRFKSYDSQMGDDPRMIIYNSRKEIFVYFENLVRYDLFLQPNTSDFEGYVYLNAGETYYLRVAKGFQTEGKVYYEIECIGDAYNELRVASTGDGTWTYDLETGIGFAYYSAIDVWLNPTDGLYYHIKEDGERGSVVYIDFIHPNFYEANDHSLYWMIEEARLFDFSKYEAGDWTEYIKRFYYEAISKDESDETYGMIEASQELVEIIATFLELYGGETIETKQWLAFANYYEYYGKP